MNYLHPSRSGFQAFRRERGRPRPSTQTCFNPSISSPLDRRTLRELQTLFFRSARDGRRRGIGLVLIAHRIAGIHKEVLMCDWLILHQPQATDLRRYCELAPTVHRERFQRLGRGKAIVVSPGGTQQVTFHRARSQDQGETPGLPALRRYQERAQGAASSEAREFPLMRPRPRASPALETRLPGQGQHASAMIPGAAEAFQGEAGTPTPLPSQHVSTGRFTSVLSPEVQRALEAWQHGHQSVDKLKSVLGITHHKAYRLYRELKARHLIA